MALDGLTREAMLRAVPLLAEMPLDGLRGKRLEAEDFDRLTVPDSIRELLRWMSAPEAFRRQANGARWEAFRNICRSEFGFDPPRIHSLVWKRPHKPNKATWLSPAVIRAPLLMQHRTWRRADAKSPGLNDYECHVDAVAQTAARARDRKCVHSWRAS